MKTVALVASYAPKPEVAGVVVAEIKKFCSRVVVFTTEDYPFDGCEVIKFGKDIKDRLTYEPRKWIVEHLSDDWDYVLYNEDDIFISEAAFRVAMTMQAQMEYPFAMGFNRYEIYQGNKYWIDQHPEHGIHTGNLGKAFIHKNETVWVPANFHSGNFLLSKDYVRRIMEAGMFDTYFREKPNVYCGLSETAASSVYRTVTKLLPIDFELVGCEHMTNKYCFSPNTPLTPDLKRILAS